jgi:hypothetical protein
MITFLLFAILIVLILGFWGDAGFGFLLAIGFGALVIVALIVALIVFGVSIGGIVVVWNNHREIIEPPLAAVIIIPLWIYCAIKVLVYVRYKIANFSLANDTTFEKFQFFVVGVPAILILSGFTLAAFAIPIKLLYQEMQKWLVVISAT